MCSFFLIIPVTFRKVNDTCKWIILFPLEVSHVNISIVVLSIVLVTPHVLRARLVPSTTLCFDEVATVTTFVIFTLLHISLLHALHSIYALTFGVLRRHLTSHLGFVFYYFYSFFVVLLLDLLELISLRTIFFLHILLKCRFEVIKLFPFSSELCPHNGW